MWQMILLEAAIRRWVIRDHKVHGYSQQQYKGRLLSLNDLLTLRGLKVCNKYPLRQGCDITHTAYIDLEWAGPEKVPYFLDHKAH